MVDKEKVRRRVALYETEIKKQIKEIEERINKMDNSCQSFEMKRIWRRSEEYIKLHTKLVVLYDVLMDVEDIRFDEMFAD